MFNFIKVKKVVVFNENSLFLTSLTSALRSKAVPMKLKVRLT